MQKKLSLLPRRDAANRWTPSLGREINPVTGPSAEGAEHELLGSGREGEKTRKGPLVGTALSLEGSEVNPGMDALRFLKRSTCRPDD